MKLEKESVRDLKIDHYYNIIRLRRDVSILIDWTIDIMLRYRQ